jgi:hypothetical protein
MVPDASFESAGPSWFYNRLYKTYFAEKEKVTGAQDGTHVLAITGWDAAGSKILSPVLTLAQPTFSASVDVRSFGPNKGATLELALFDKTGAKKLASFGKTELDGLQTWKSISNTNVPLTTATSEAKLALIVSGPMDGMRVEVDKLGLFAGPSLGQISDNAQWTWFEAEELADGKQWKIVDDIGVQDQASGLKLIRGMDSVSALDNKPVSKTIDIQNAGNYKLWVRFFQPPETYKKSFTIVLKQNGSQVASKTFEPGDPQYGPSYRYTQASMDAQLTAGPVEMQLIRDTASSSWASLNIDMFLLTNMTDYQFRMQDVRPAGYMRYTNKSASLAPYCLYGLLIRNYIGNYSENLGMLSAAGFNRGYRAQLEKCLGPNQISPWIKITDDLQPSATKNILSLTATRATHTAGYVDGKIEGDLEFAVGDDHQVIKKIAISQNAPRIKLLLPYDITNPEDIGSSKDYIAKAESEASKLPVIEPRAKHININANINLESGIDDPVDVERELKIISRLGFNSTYSPTATRASEIDSYNTRFGILPRLGILFNALGGNVINGDANNPDIARITTYFTDLASRYKEVLNKVERIKLMDEPDGMTYESILASDFSKTAFRSELQAAGYTPTQLGVSTWDQVLPVLPSQKNTLPKLFYQTGLYRLNSLVKLIKAGISVKNSLMSPNVKGYVNFVPTGSGFTWNERGLDPFFIQRNSGIGLGWTEDWLTWTAGPQQMSEQLAIMRSAAQPINQPLGSYTIIEEGPDSLIRTRFYELLAGGVRTISAYPYGPNYSVYDSWSTRYSAYPILNKVLSEVAKIDEPLNDTVRKKTDIAIYYNRTAGIWEENSAMEQDSRFTLWALNHAGYDADFISDEDIEAGKLSSYKLLYLNGRQVKSTTSQAISSWVSGGGTLFGSAGAGDRNEYNEDSATLDNVFGAKTQSLTIAEDPKRPRYELRTLKPLSNVTSTTTDTPTVSFKQLAIREDIQPLPNSKTILKNTEGKPVGVLNNFGSGRAIRIAGLPGLAYIYTAITAPGYNPDNYKPTAYDPALRDFIAWPAKLAGATRIAEANIPTTQMARYDKSGKTVFFVINHGDPSDSFKMKVSGTNFKSAYTASGKAATLSASGDTTEVSFPLDDADAVVLESDSSITPTPTQSPNPSSPSPTQAITPAPTAIVPTIPPGNTSLLLTLLLHGLGKGGDNSNANGGGTANPLRTQRNVSVEIFNSQNQLTFTKQATVKFNQTAGNFTGIVDLGTTIPTGNYTVKVKTDQFLKKLVPLIQPITQGQNTTLPQITLISGDMNNDNRIDALDYNILIDCYSDITPAKNCSDQVKKLTADITDDGAVNQFDYNLFLRELTNISGE